MTPRLVRQKHFLRRHFRAVVRMMPATRRRRDALRAAARLCRLPVFRRARTVGLYMPRLGEVDVRPLWTACRRAGKAVAVPVIDAERKSLRFVVVTRSARFRPNVYGIPEPVAAPRRTAVARPDVVVVPGAAFTAKGRRLGAGGGYYDRFLRNGRAVSVGLAYSCQMTRHLPREPHDRPVTLVVTPDHMYH